MQTAHSEWGLAGIESLRNRASAFIIVDILSFCTAVDIAVARGASVYPFALGDPVQARAAAAKAGAMLALPRRAAGGQFSLSPASLLTIAPGTRLMLPSPNGSRLSLATGGVPTFAACLRNAAAVARAARAVAGQGDIAVIPAGERWPDGGLRPAIEDLIGAGAVLHHLALPCSPEAEVAREAYRGVGASLARLIRDSVSGRELRDSGFGEDVELAVDECVSGAAPILAEGAYRAEG